MFHLADLRAFIPLSYSCQSFNSSTLLRGTGSLVVTLLAMPLLHKAFGEDPSEMSTALGQLVKHLHCLGARLFLVSPKSRLPLDLILDCKVYE